MDVKDQIVKNALEIHEIIEGIKPQTDNGKLNYYYAGSFSFALLSQADSLKEVEEEHFEKLDQLETGEKISLSDDAKDTINKMIRPFHDIDVIGGISNKEKTKELSDDFSQTYKGEEFIDYSLLNLTPKKAVEVSIDDKKYYTVSPDNAFINKLIYSVEQASRNQESSRYEKTNMKNFRDLDLLYKLIKQMYSKDKIDQLPREVYQIFSQALKHPACEQRFGENRSMNVSDYISIIQNNPSFSKNSDFSQFLEQVVEYERDNIEHDKSKKVDLPAKERKAKQALPMQIAGPVGEHLKAVKGPGKNHIEMYK